MKITMLKPTAPILKPRKRVAAYCRVSIETDRLQHSLSAQISHYSEFIQQNPEWIYAGVFADDAVSGTGTERRPEFKRLMEDCEAGRINIVLVKSISRFARNTIDLLKTVRRLKELGVDVWFEEQGIHSMDGDGELMLTILASFAQEESWSISENCKWSIRKKYEKGEPHNSILYGYRPKKGTLVIEESEASVVRRVFDMFLSGESAYMIAKKLNEDGLKSYRGKDFTTSVICRILHQEKYAGNTMMQKFFAENHITHRLVRNKGELPRYYGEGTHPAIISMETFQQAQALFTPHPRRWTDAQRKALSEAIKSRDTFPYRRRYALTLFLKCDGCGENLSAKKNSPDDVRWVCHNHRHAAPDAPRPMLMQDSTLKEIICDVLHLPEFDEATMTEQLTHISALGPLLTFHFRDGHTEQRTYAHKRRTASCQK